MRGVERRLGIIVCHVGLLFIATRALSAQTPVESSSETRFQLDLKVPDAALKAMLPGGFTSSVAAQGPAKDCNLRLVFIDRITVNAPEGKPLGKGSNRLAYLVAPAKDAAGASVQVVIGGITEDPNDAPGPFGNYLPATTHEMHKTTTAGASGPILETQDWVFAASSGEHLELHIKYERGVGNRGAASDAKFYSAKSPALYQISHQEQVLDILRNTTTNPPDRVKEFTLKASGGSYDKLLDSTVKVLSWDNILWINRTVSKP
ncbi:hypothetical protein FTO74_02620 [Granulicella sp. WH15]|uniref:hypothetical protein n=1 Tax=Granulicella sp. WH15 TaxID=2602070 RepID=UPI0013676C56|nr:hypothetical protein [Granulicella sp. WH15]QHN02391.1 hypothetical protein FTO74_02620 [Granulicella sp. WH15]